MTDRVPDRAAEPIPARRGFLKALGLSAGVAAAAPALAADDIRSDVAKNPRKENEADRLRTRYRETAHVRAFYQTNRY